MNMPNDLEHYIQKGIVQKITPDVSRAKFLFSEANTCLEGLKERIKLIGINNKNSNSIIKDCYDIMIELIRAKFLLDGYSASGNFAHEAEISYLKKLEFSENEILFLNELRYFRNSITYYGKLLNKEYAEKVYFFLNKILPKLLVFNKR